MNDGQNPGFVPQSQQPQTTPAPNTFANFAGGQNQGQSQSQGQQFQSAQAHTPVFNAGNAIPQMGNNAVSNASPISGDRRPLTFIVIIIITSLIAVTFVGLFIWMAAQYSAVNGDVEGKVTAAVAEAVNDNTKKLEDEFTEREKSPYRTFSGPADYGELSFKYPKTWSVYVAKDANEGGDFEAYLNPDVVEPVNAENINALRVTIKNTSYDNEIKTYEGNIKNGKLTSSVRQVGGSNATIYTGELPSGKIQGIVALIKLRDKVVLIQTDAMVFEKDFYNILDTVTYKS